MYINLFIISEYMYILLLIADICIKFSGSKDFLNKKLLTK